MEIEPNGLLDALSRGPPSTWTILSVVTPVPGFVAFCTSMFSSRRTGGLAGCAEMSNASVTGPGRSVCLDEETLSGLDPGLDASSPVTDLPLVCGDVTLGDDTNLSDGLIPLRDGDFSSSARGLAIVLALSCPSNHETFGT